MSKSRDIADSAATINYIDGLTSDAQTQLNAKETADATILKDADIGSTVQAYDSNLTGFVGAFTLPTTDGTADQILKTDGSGTLGFTDAGGGAWEEISSGYVINSSGLTLNWTANNYRVVKVYLNRLYVSADSTLEAQIGTSSSIITASDYDNTFQFQGTGNPSGSSSLNDTKMKLTGNFSIDREDITSAYTPGAFFEITIPMPIFTTSVVAAPQAWRCEAVFGGAGVLTYPYYIKNIGFLDKTTDEYIIEQIKIYAPSTTFTASYSVVGLKI